MWVFLTPGLGTASHDVVAVVALTGCCCGCWTRLYRKGGAPLLSNDQMAVRVSRVPACVLLGRCIDAVSVMVMVMLLLLVRTCTPVFALDVVVQQDRASQRYRDKNVRVVPTRLVLHGIALVNAAVTVPCGCVTPSHIRARSTSGTASAPTAKRSRRRGFLAHPRIIRSSNALRFHMSASFAYTTRTDTLPTLHNTTRSRLHVSPRCDTKQRLTQLHRRLDVCGDDEGRQCPR